MNLTEIKETPLFRKKPIRVGRGSGSGKGKTCGRGTKGQRSRSGMTTPTVFEGGTMPLYRRLPKRGFKNARFQKDWVSVNLGELNKLNPGDEVTLEVLEKAGIVKIKNSKNYSLKVLGGGELKVENLKIKAHKISTKAKEKVEQAKGNVEIIEPKPKQTKSRRKKP